MAEYRILKVKGRDTDISGGYYKRYHYTEDVFIVQRKDKFLVFSYWKTIDHSLNKNWAEFSVEYDKEKRSLKAGKPVVVKEYD